MYSFLRKSIINYFYVRFKVFVETSRVATKKSPCIKRFYLNILHCVCLFLLEFTLNGTSYVTINWRKECGFSQRLKAYREKIINRALSLCNKICKPSSILSERVILHFSAQKRLLINSIDPHKLKHFDQSIVFHNVT